MVDEKQKAQTLSFEAALDQLKGIVLGLESGDIPLAELVNQFQKGNNLLTICNEQLKSAQISLEKLKATTTDATMCETEPLEF